MQPKPLSNIDHYFGHNAEFVKKMLPILEEKFKIHLSLSCRPQIIEGLIRKYGHMLLKEISEQQTTFSSSMPPASCRAALYGFLGFQINTEEMASFNPNSKTHFSPEVSDIDTVIRMISLMHSLIARNNNNLGKALEEVLKEKRSYEMGIAIAKAISMQHSTPKMPSKKSSHKKKKKRTVSSIPSDPIATASQASSATDKAIPTTEKAAATPAATKAIAAAPAATAAPTETEFFLIQFSDESSKLEFIKILGESRLAELSADCRKETISIPISSINPETFELISCLVDALKAKLFSPENYMPTDETNAPLAKDRDAAAKTTTFPAIAMTVVATTTSATTTTASTTATAISTTIAAATDTATPKTDTECFIIQFRDASSKLSFMDTLGESRLAELKADCRKKTISMPISSINPETFDLISCLVDALKAKLFSPENYIPTDEASEPLSQDRSVLHPSPSPHVEKTSANITPSPAASTTTATKVAATTPPAEETIPIKKSPKASAATTKTSPKTYGYFFSESSNVASKTGIALSKTSAKIATTISAKPESTAPLDACAATTMATKDIPSPAVVPCTDETAPAAKGSGEIYAIVFKDSQNMAFFQSMFPNSESKTKKGKIIVSVKKENVDDESSFTTTVSECGGTFLYKN
jgi:hypothetical protein